MICSSNVKQLKSRLTEGYNTFRVKVIRLKDRDADRVIRRLEHRQKKQRLKRSDLLQLLLTPLMGGGMSQQERIARALVLLKEERKYHRREEQISMEAVLYMLAMKFLSEPELKKIKEMMNMTMLGEMILQDGIEIGRKEGREEGRREGETRVNRLIEALIETDRLEDLKRASKDRAFQEQLMAELFPEET